MSYESTVKRPMVLLITGVAGCLLAASAANSHDVWMVTKPVGTTNVADIVFGDLTAPSLADVKRIVSFQLVAPTGSTDLRPLLSAAESNGHPVLETKPFAVPAGSLLAITYDNGFWLRQPQDKLETNTNPLLAPKGLEPHWTVKWGKTLLGPGASATVLHTRLELIALQDPFSAKAGTTLPVRLEYEGKPFPDAEIAYTDGLQPLPDEQQPTVKTGADGVAQIPIKGAGPYLLTTDVTTPPAHAALAHQDHLYTSLAFDTSQR